ncbi:8145_t:CDS:1, partial [Dentiscutata erythropus]
GRPDCSEILEDLEKIIQQSKSFKFEDNEIKNTTKTKNTTSKFELHFNFNDCELNIDDLEKQAKLQIQFINNLGLNKGRNLDKFDIAFGIKTILGELGALEVKRLRNQEPIIIIPIKDLNITDDIPPEYDIVRLHFPTASVSYKGDVNEQFIQEIKTVLDSSNDDEKKKSTVKKDI